MDIRNISSAVTQEHHDQLICARPPLTPGTDWAEPVVLQSERCRGKKGSEKVNAVVQVSLPGRAIEQTNGNQLASFHT